METGGVSVCVNYTRPLPSPPPYQKHQVSPAGTAPQRQSQVQQQSALCLENIQPAASEPGPSTPPSAKRSKRTKAELAAEPTQPTKGKGKAKGKAAEAKTAPQPGRWLDRDTKSCLNFQRIGESMKRPLELCSWKDLESLPPIGNEYEQR
ncbi:hypothetical protein QJQ45_013726 [Haematococcus lacustris]|nr:hypothetical protein QJQ45_013726 [Haematococcus lacustris]